MLNQELILLGILKEGPKHGYEIKKRIKEIIENLALPPISSIYYPLQILEKQKLVVKKKGREGKRPKKYTYSLTDKGKARFLELLEQSLLVIKKPNFDLNISLFFLSHVDTQVAIRRLSARKRFLEKIKDGVSKIQLSQAETSGHIKRILEHNSALVQAEIDFVSRMIKSISKGKK